MIRAGGCQRCKIFKTRLKEQYKKIKREEDNKIEYKAVKKTFMVEKTNGLPERILPMACQL